MTPVPSLAIVGARVRTLDPDRPDCSAIAIHDGSIVATGSDQEIRALCDGSTELIDGGGMFIVPGLTDSHIHPVWAAMSTRGADLTQAMSIDEIRIALAAERQRVGPDSWVTGWGAVFEPFAETGIRGDLFEEAVQGQPLVFRFFDGHTAAANPHALGLADIGGPRVFAEQAAVVCDANGVPTGELQENAAINLVERVVPEITDEQFYGLVKDLFRNYAAVGLTNLHAMDGDPGQIALLKRLEANGDLVCRVVLPMWQKPETGWEEMRDRLRYREAHGRRWRSGTAKFFIDGVIESGTAWLLQPDTHGDGTLPFWPDPTRYQEAVALFARDGWACTTHAVGDAAVRCALDAYEAAGPVTRGQHRIEHIELIDDQDVPRFVRLNVTASMQPLHMRAFRPDASDVWGERVGPERAAKPFRTRTLLAAGATLALGSDWMVAPYDPRIGMAWAQLRRAGGQPGDPQISPEQALTGLEVLEGYTTKAAITVGDQSVSGRIKPGYRADLTAFADDPVTCGGDVLATLPVLLTMTDGEITHRSVA